MNEAGSMNDISEYVSLHDGKECTFIITANISFLEACQLLKEKGGCIQHKNMTYDDVEDRGDGWAYTIPLYFCVDRYFTAYLCDSEFTCGFYEGDDSDVDLPEYWHDYIELDAYLSKEWSHGFYDE